MTDTDKKFVEEFLDGLNGGEATIKHKDLAGVKYAGRCILAIMLVNGENPGVKNGDFADFVMSNYDMAVWEQNRHYAVYALEVIGGEQWSDMVAAAVDEYFQEYDYPSFKHDVVESLLTKLQELKSSQGT